jgi:hypothetical protein
MVLYNLRMVYKREASSRKRPFSAFIAEDDPEEQQDPQPLQLQPEAAVIDVDMSPSRTRKNSHAGWGFVTVANRRVADILVQASFKNSLNCAPPTKSLLRSDRHRNAVLTYSNIRRNPRDVPLAKVALPACGFGIVEVMRGSHASHEDAQDASEPAEASAARSKQHQYCVLWETKVTEVGNVAPLLSRACTRL